MTYRFNTKYCDLFTESAEWKCITTNGFIKKDGTGVMGAGIAKQATEVFPYMETQLGENLARFGNEPAWLALDGVSGKKVERYVSFPVKHHWREKADLELISNSLTKLYKMWIDFIFLSDDEKVYKHPPQILLPKPGCGNGQLEWREVAECLNKTLDNLGMDKWDQLTIVDRPEK